MKLETFREFLRGFLGLIEDALYGMSQVVLVDMPNGTPDVTMLSLLFVGVFTTIVIALITGVTGRESVQVGTSKRERPKGKVNR